MVECECTEPADHEHMPGCPMRENAIRRRPAAILRGYMGENGIAIYFGDDGTIDISRCPEPFITPDIMLQGTQETPVETLMGLGTITCGEPEW